MASAGECFAFPHGVGLQRRMPYWRQQAQSTAISASAGECFAFPHGVGLQCRMPYWRQPAQATAISADIRKRFAFSHSMDLQHRMPYWRTPAQVKGTRASAGECFAFPRNRSMAMLCFWLAARQTTALLARRMRIPLRARKQIGNHLPFVKAISRRTGIQKRTYRKGPSCFDGVLTLSAW